MIEVDGKSIWDANNASIHRHFSGRNISTLAYIQRLHIKTHVSWLKELLSSTFSTFFLYVAYDVCICRCSRPTAFFTYSVTSKLTVKFAEVFSYRGQWTRCGHCSRPPSSPTSSRFAPVLLHSFAFFSSFCGAAKFQKSTFCFRCHNFLLMFRL